MQRPPIEELKRSAFTAECEIGNYMRMLPSEVTELCDYTLALEPQLAAATTRAERAEANCAAMREVLEEINDYALSFQGLNTDLKEVADISSKSLTDPLNGAELLEQVKVLERALEIACEYTACPYMDSMGSALPCDNNDLQCPQCFLAQAKEDRP